MMSTMSDNTTIQIKKTTKQTLDTLGSKNTTYDDIIQDLLKK